MTERDIKLLWGRSGNRCAICKTELSQDKKLSSDKFLLGEQAHVVGEKESAPRGKSNLSEPERDGYANRILLCPNHHTKIDKDEQFYSIERLHLLKQQHELWVQEKLSEGSGNTQADGLIYSTLIDTAVEQCGFANWNKWVPSADAGDFAEWPESIITGIADFHDRVFRAAWPGTRTELEQALKTFAITLFKAREEFLLHAEYQHLSKTYTGVAFYKRTWHEQPVYDRLLKQYNRWCAEYTFWLRLATKAINWLSDVVRSEMNPMFFAQEGRFVYERISDGMTGKIPEFRMAEKRKLPAALKNMHINFVEKFKKEEENWGKS